METVPASTDKSRRLWLVTFPMGIGAAGLVIAAFFPVDAVTRTRAFLLSIVAAGWCHWIARTIYRLRSPEATVATGKRKHLLGFSLINVGLLTAFLGWTAGGVYCEVPAGTQFQVQLSEEKYTPYSPQYDYHWWQGTRKPSSSATYQATGSASSTMIMRVTGARDDYGFLPVRAPFSLGSGLVNEKGVKMLNSHPLLPLPREAGIVFGLIAIVALYIGFRIYIESLRKPADENCPQ